MLRDLIPWGFGRRATDAEPSSPSAPEHPLVELQREMNRAFDGFWRGFDLEPFGFARGGADAFAPRVDVRDADDKVTVSAELPGLDDKDIRVDFQDGALRIEGEKKRETKEAKEGAQYSEIRYGSFSRVIPVRAEIDASKVSASFKKGVLTVELPKTKRERESVRRIEVRAG